MCDDIADEPLVVQSVYGSVSAFRCPYTFPMVRVRLLCL